MISTRNHKMLKEWCERNLGSKYAADSLFDEKEPEKGFDFEELVAESVSSWCCGESSGEATIIAERLREMSKSDAFR